MYKYFVVRSNKYENILKSKKDPVSFDKDLYECAKALDCGDGYNYFLQYCRDLVDKLSTKKGLKEVGIIKKILANYKTTNYLDNLFKAKKVKTLIIKFILSNPPEIPIYQPIPKEFNDLDITPLECSPRTEINNYFLMFIKEFSKYHSEMASIEPSLFYKQCEGLNEDAYQFQMFERYNLEPNALFCSIDESLMDKFRNESYYMYICAPNENFLDCIKDYEIKFFILLKICEIMSIYGYEIKGLNYIYM